MVRVEINRICEYDGCERCKTRVVDVERGYAKCAGLSCEIEKMVGVYYIVWDAS